MRLEISPYGREYYSIVRSRFPKTTRRTHYSEYGQMSTSVECGPNNSYPRPRKAPSSSVYKVIFSNKIDWCPSPDSFPCCTSFLKSLSALTSSAWIVCPDRDGQSITVDLSSMARLNESTAPTESIEIRESRKRALPSRCLLRETMHEADSFYRPFS